MAARGTIGAAIAGVSGTTVTLANPGYVPGTGVLAIVGWGNNATITGVPSGWTLVGSVSTWTTTGRLAVYKKIIAADEPSQWVWTFSATSTFAQVLTCDYVNVGEAVADGSSIVFSSGANSLTLTWPAITLANTRTIVSYGAQGSSRTPSAPPAGYTDRYTVVPRRMYAFDRVVAAAGVHAAFNRTLDNGSGGHGLARLVLVDGTAPAKTADPSIAPTSGVQVGTQLTCTPGTYTGDPAPAVTRQWQSSPAGAGTWSNIGGATGLTYTPSAGDAGKDIRCVETAANNSGSTTGTSNTVTVSAPGSPAATSLPLLGAG